MANLYVKYSTGDVGGRPVPAGEPYWVSPSVWLTDAAGNGVPSARVGQTNRIYATVHSLGGPDLSHVRFQVWVCNYTAGGVGPVSVLPSGGAQGAGGAQGRTVTVQTAVSPAAPGTAYVDWVPDATALINTGDEDRGHVCVGVNVYVEGDTQEGTIKQSGSLDIVNDPHHAQRNITVVRTGPTRRMLLPFRAANASPDAQEFVLAVTPLDGDAVMGQVEREQLLTAAFVDLVGGEPLVDPVPATCLTEPRERTRLALGGDLVLRGLPDPVPLRPAQNSPRFELLTENGRDQKIPLEIAPGDQVPVTLGVDVGGEWGEVHGFDVVQTDRTGTVVGGGRVLVVDAPEWLCC